MNITLTKDMEQYVRNKVRSGRYLDVSEVVRDALRALAQRDDFESPALEAALLEGVRSPHCAYNKTTLEKVRKAVRGTK